LTEVIRKIQRNKIEHEPIPEVRLEERVLARAHEDRVERVIGHIVQNAIDATEKTGHITVTLRREGEKAIVEVCDTGHGMTDDFVRERLFKPFQTTKQGGMGIGAYESYQYVHELGGDILVESTPGVGTKMSVVLPVYETPNAEVEQKAMA
jgi:signal transduction histidine kinase